MKLFGFRKSSKYNTVADEAPVENTVVADEATAETTTTTTTTTTKLPQGILERAEQERLEAEEARVAAEEALRAREQAAEVARQRNLAELIVALDDVAHLVEREAQSRFGATVDVVVTDFYRGSSYEELVAEAKARTGDLTFEVTVNHYEWCDEYFEGSDEVVEFRLHGQVVNSASSIVAVVMA